MVWNGRLGQSGPLRLDSMLIEQGLAGVLSEYFSHDSVGPLWPLPSSDFAPDSEVKLALAVESERVGIEVEPDWVGIDPILPLLVWTGGTGGVFYLHGQGVGQPRFSASVASGFLEGGDRLEVSGDCPEKCAGGSMLGYLRRFPPQP